MSINFIQKIEDIKANVKKILEEDPDARDNDNWLIWKYWAKFDDPQMRGFIGALGVKRIMYILTNTETIRRSRQQIQNTDKHLGPTAKVLKKRLNKQVKMREAYARKKDKETMEEFV